MSKEIDSSIGETFVRASRELAEGEPKPEQLEAIVAELSDEERPKFRKLFSNLAERLQPNRAQLEQTEKLFGRDFMGPAQFERAWGFCPAPEQIPVIPFSPERLERAKQLGMMLVLHVDKTPDGKPMTMKNMNSMQIESGRNESLFRSGCEADWYQDEDYYTQDVPRLSWKLEAKEVLRDSNNRSEVGQLHLILEYLKNAVFEGMEIPADYQEAIEEFKARKVEIIKLMERHDTWKKASEIIENLKLSKLTRATPVELIQTIETYHRNTCKHLFPILKSKDHYEVCVRTPRRNSSDGLVYIGRSPRDGADVNGTPPEVRERSIGVALSLRS